MIRTERDQGVAIITIDRPDQRNALTPEMLTDLHSAVVESNDASAILVRGEGKVFCAGFDLTLCKDDPHGSVMRSLLEGLSNSIVAMRNATPPVVLAAHGAAIAGGCALLGGADVVVTDPDAKLGYPVLLLGVSPAVSAPFLRLGVGDGAARRTMLDPTLISGRRAHEIGLANELADDPRDEALRIARDLASKPRSGLDETKRWLNELDGVLGSGSPKLALDASTVLTGGQEEQQLLERFWSRNA